MEDTLRAGGGEAALCLIETLLWDGKAAPRWPLHLARLRRSAARLGWPEPPVGVPPAPARPARLRLTMDRQGRIEWQVAPLPPALPEWRVSVSGLVLTSADPWLSIKSTRRPLHDAARAALPPGVDEAILANERGEVCEGTIANVFFDRGDGMRTPPLSCGLLPGILRQELACPEEVLTLADLPHVRLWLGNAPRGLIPARLLEPPTCLDPAVRAP